MRSRTAFIFTAFITTAVYGEDWKIIPTVSPDIIFSINTSSIERSENLVTFHEKLVFEKADRTDPVSGKPIKEKHTRRIMDCKGKTQGLLEGSMFDADGKLIEMVNFDKDQLDMTDIPKGTIAEQELDLVCAAVPNNTDSATKKP